VRHLHFDLPEAFLIIIKMIMYNRKSIAVLIITIIASIGLFGADKKPNIVWICIEDASPHISCYGETAIKTPVMDQLAADGIRFTQAFVTAPVCSSSRSAIVTGMYQMTTGFHHHRSQRFSGKGNLNTAYYKSYNVPKEMVTVPELFKQVGYYTANTRKQDYNFEREGLYDSEDYSGWDGRKDGQPFFVQFQLKGGKNRKSIVGVDQSKIKVPPYYADDEVMRDDWITYLGSWVATDIDVAKILDQLKAEGELENTYIFLWTDHGVSHIRGKQFLYDEGIQVPLIIRFPNKQKAGTVRKDQVTHIDISVTSLALAGIEVPSYMQGKNIFADNYVEQKKVVAGRDRCDETVDFIRSVRTSKYKYIRNFLHDVSHMQPSQYKDGKKIVKHSRQLFEEGKLNELQSRPFLSTRPVEELYDLKKDPFETKNLAGDKRHKKVLKGLRNDLEKWMIKNNDLGLIPEPILEDKGKQYGSKYAVMLQAENKDLLKDILSAIDSCDAGDKAAIEAALSSSEPSIRYWAARTVGSKKITSLKEAVQSMLKDKDGTVRVAAAHSMVQLGDMSGVKILKKEMRNKNLLVGMYAIRALEAIGPKAKAETSDEIKDLAEHKTYEFTRRVAKRLVGKWDL